MTTERSVSREASLRLKMTLLCAACVLLNYADRVNISVVILPMAKEYAWNTADQATVMSAFFFGYLVMQFGGALLARRFGAKLVLSVGALLWSGFTALTPFSADIGFNALCSCRFFMGLAEGVAFPAVYHFLAGWIPSSERGRALSTVFTGTHIGTTVALLLSPKLASMTSWRMVFWTFGAAGAGWILGWHNIAYDKELEPEKEVAGQRLSDAGCDDSVLPVLIDRSHSNCSLPGLATEKRNGMMGVFRRIVSASERRAVAFILGNPACLAVCFTQFSVNLSHYVVLSWLPTYFAEVYNVNLAALSFTAVPYISMAFCCNLGGWGADYLTTRGMSLTRVRKVVTIISCSGAAFFFIAFSLAPTVGSAILAVTLALCFQSLCSGGFDSSYLDMSSPSLAGTFKSIANTLGAGSGVVAMPYTTTLLRLTDGSWRAVFGCLAFYHITAMIVFCRYSTSERILVEEDTATGS